MKNHIIIALSLLFFGTASIHRAAAQTDFDDVPWQEISLDCSSLTAANHPRLFLTDKEFKAHKKTACRGGYVGDIHNIMMKVAAQSMEKNEPLEYKKDASGKRILYVSNEALTRIASLSYAYRFTGNKAYLKKAEWNMECVCSFPDWNPSHFLDPSEMAMAVSIGYDWLYNKLSSRTRAIAGEKLRDYALEEVAHGKGQNILKRSGNWNQVCNASMTAAAIATYENNPDLSYEVIRRCLESNIPAAKAIYSPDGAFPEGIGYWEYGTCFQEFLILLYECTFGSDLGLSKIEGFSQTGLYKAFSRNGAGHVFNYSDSSDRLVPSPALWYLAWKFGNPDILYDELQFLQKDDYMSDRRLILAVITAGKMGNVKIKEPEQRLFVANGKNPVLMAKAGWGKDDLYLGLKGGTGSAGHSHLDVGSFVFDGYGTRWVADYYLRNYQKYENMCKEMGLELKEFSNVKDGSLRWKLFIYNNRQHSTLTVNGHDHKAKGFASIINTWDTPERLGGELDLKQVFKGDLRAARRSAAIINGKYLEVCDTLYAPKDTAAHIRFTIVTPVKPKVEEGRILLNDGKTTMVLSCDNPQAVFRTWSSNPADYDSPTAPYEEKLRKHWICGYEYDIQAGEKACVTTTLKKK